MAKPATEAFLRQWAIWSFALVVLLSFFGSSLAANLAHAGDPLRFLGNAAIALLVGGFYLCLLYDAIATRRYRWIVVFLFLPILSAYIYYVVTRIRAEKTA